MINQLQKLSKFLSSQTSAFIILIAGIAFFFPQIFEWVKGDNQTIVLGIIMLTMGMTLSKKDFEILLLKPFDICIGTIAQYTFMPLIAFSLLHFLHLP